MFNGKYDGAQDSVIEPFFKYIEKVKWVRFAESSHFPQYEEPERYLKVVSDFLLMEWNGWKTWEGEGWSHGIYRCMSPRIPYQPI
jgi:hypothetical protein